LALGFRSRSLAPASLWFDLGETMMNSMNYMLVGAIGMSSIVIGLFFLRFWKSTGDRFFLFFSTSFFLEGFNRIFSAFIGGPSDQGEVYYLIRLLSYVLILLAILDKNFWQKRKK
jgi:hypothetical protein